RTARKSEGEVCPENRRELTQQTSVQTLTALIKRFFKQFRIIRRAIVHPQVPWYAKVVAGCAFLYVISPIQLIPDFIPIVGQMDDVLVVILGIKFLRRCVPQSVLDDCENDSPVPLIPTIVVGPATDPLPELKS
ncbi:MAG: DUF1232 domain-containing protein, partial [Silvibacterium sp.]